MATSALADQTDNGTINAMDPNLKAFFAHGGKLLQYHGWADQLISPLNSVNYYKSVRKALGTFQQGEGLLPPVHDSGHGPLPWRRGTQ